MGNRSNQRRARTAPPGTRAHRRRPLLFIPPLPFPHDHECLADVVSDVTRTALFGLPLAGRRRWREPPTNPSNVPAGDTIRATATIHAPTASSTKCPRER